MAVDTKKGMKVSLPQPGKRSIFAGRALEDLELTIDKHDGKGEQKVKTFEYNAKIYKIRNMEKMEKQQETTASSTDKENFEEVRTSINEENSTTTESVPNPLEPNNATSTATSTPGVSERSGTFPVGMLPLIGASIFGVELRKFKKNLSLWTLLFCLPFILSYVVRLVFRVDIFRDIGLEKMWRQFVGPDNLFHLILTVPLIVFPLSLLHYNSRKTVYKTWLAYSGLGSVLFTGTIVIYIIDPPGSGVGVVSLYGIEFILLGIAYIAGSIIIWLYGAITHFFRKKIK